MRSVTTPFKTVSHPILDRLPLSLLNKISRFGLYFFVSLAALLLDVLIFSALTYGTPVRVGAAAAIGWSAGLIAHYCMAQNWLYHGLKKQRRLIAQVRSFLTYAAPSVAGLGLTVLVVEIGVALGVSAILAKAAAAILSFLMAYALRNLMFNRPSEALPA